MATFSRSHQFQAGVTPAWSTAHTVHGRVVAHIWSDDGLTFDLRLTRPDGAQLVLTVPAAPNHVWDTPLDPDELLVIEARNTGTDINVLVI